MPALRSPLPPGVSGASVKPSGPPRFFNDLSPLVMIVINGQTYTDVQEYSYDTDILQLGDPFSLVIDNSDGKYAGLIHRGDPIKLYFADPNVNGGSWTLKLQGVITKLDWVADGRQGDTVRITGADLGWHLTTNCAPLWYRLRGRTLATLLGPSADGGTVDPSWGFTFPIRGDNSANRKLKQGRGDTIAVEIAPSQFFYPIVQAEPGEMIADIAIRYAKRQHTLINVSADGVIQIWQPDYAQQVSYAFHHYNIRDKARIQNNVKRATLTESIDTVYTEVSCVGTVLNNYIGPDPTDPNALRFRGDADKTTTKDAAPFLRRLTFSDQEPLDVSTAKKRALWRWQRGVFDAWTLEYTVPGHSQLGIDGRALMYEPDTIAEVHDTVFGINAKCYVSAVRYTRSLDPNRGTETLIRMKPIGLLS